MKILVLLKIIFFNSRFSYSINEDNVDKLWRTWEKMNNIEHRKPPKFQPADFETIKELGKQLEEVKKNQQPIIINPSPVYPYPTNIPQWEPYTTTWTTTADGSLAKKAGDAE